MTTSTSRTAALTIGRGLAMAAAASALVFVLAPPARAASDAPPAAVRTAPSDDAVKSLALKWFAAMQSGAIDRSQLAPSYNAELTDEAVQGMAKYMRDHAYGAPPLRAEILAARRTAEQSIYVVKLVFPRGDAASLMIGVSADGKITGLNLMSMAGD